MVRPYDHTSLGGANRQFPQTEWTRMLDGRQREEVLVELCQDYWKPIYSYLRAMGFRNEQAKDLAQGFFTDKVLGQDLIRKADRTKGRFRNFLLRSVRNYAISIQRTAKPHRSLDGDREDPVSAGNPEAEFNRVWADGLLQEVLAELEQECGQRGKEMHWHVFHDWLLDPQIEQKKTMSEICLRYGVQDSSKAYHMIENVKRRFRALLRSRLGQVVASNVDAEAEIREFIGIFSGGSAGT
jgi:DNA-directed RNA polymerase specialized sigma24 family protein